MHLCAPNMLFVDLWKNEASVDLKRNLKIKYWMEFRIFISHTVPEAQVGFFNCPEYSDHAKNFV